MRTIMLRWAQMLAGKASLLGCVVVFSLASGVGQITQAPEMVPANAGIATTRTQMTNLRDRFVKATMAAGFTCPIAAPAIAVEDVPSFGQYEPSSNTLRTSDWSVLRPGEKAFFSQLAGPGASEASARDLFEVAAHKWIIVHELGHWWQACTGGNADRTHYEVEYGANRTALAYWREVDPGVVETMIPIFQGVLDHAPSPVPPGQSTEAYFNKNYETLGPSPAYPWFMSRMNVSAYEEKPIPRFAEVLASTKK